MNFTFRLLFLLLFLQTQFVLFAGNKLCVISGKIDNPVSDSLFLKTDDSKIIAACKLNKDNGFKMKVEIEEGYYRIGDNNEHTELFLSPGFNLHLTIDTKLFDESIQYKGKGSSENNYLAKSYLLDRKS